jgi:DNA-binding LacI/PurR family transcriptional regulator
LATIGDVAREAGVARSTVSSVLTGRKFVAPDTRTRVEAAIAKLNYSVNAGARALATSRTMNIGVVVRFHEAEFIPALATYLVALSDEAARNGYYVTLMTDVEGREAVSSAIAGRRVDGLVLLSVVEDDPRLEPIVQASFPAVMIGMPQETHGVDAVDLDFGEGARLLVSHLAELDIRRVAFIRWPDELYEAGSTYAIRFAAAARSCADSLGLDMSEIPCGGGPEQARGLLAEHLRRSPADEAMLIHNDTAVAMLPFALQDAGLSDPDARAIVSLHSAELARLYALPYTSVESAAEVVVGRAVKLLLSRIAEPESPSTAHLVSPRLIRRRG